MKPFSNKVNIPLLIIAVGLLRYFLIDLATILNGIAVISSPVYPLYISIGVSALGVLLFTFSTMCCVEHIMHGQDRLKVKHKQ